MTTKGEDTFEDIAGDAAASTYAAGPLLIHRLALLLSEKEPGYPFGPRWDELRATEAERDRLKSELTDLEARFSAIGDAVRAAGVGAHDTYARAVKTLATERDRAIAAHEREAASVETFCQRFDAMAKVLGCSADDVEENVRVKARSAYIQGQRDFRARVADLVPEEP